MTKKLEAVVVGPFMVNCYLYRDAESSRGVIIDPGDEAEKIFEAVEKTGLKPEAILLTHGHIDHIAAVEDVKKKYDIPIYVGQGEEALLADPRANASSLLDEPVIVPEPEFIIGDEEEISPAGLKLRVLATPGHTPGGVCYLDETEGLLFCGDTLFQLSIGRTDLPGGSYEQLMDSIRNKIMKLPDGIVCLPGHGPSTTVGAERNANPFLTGGYFA